MVLINERRKVLLSNDLAKELFGIDIEKDLNKPLFELLKADIFLSISSGE